MAEPEITTERASELLAIAELWGQTHHKYAWPPEALAPGVALRRRRVSVRDQQTQEIKSNRIYLVPYVEDPREFYANLRLRDVRPEDAGNCSMCNGAGRVRSDRPVGSVAFNRMSVCPRWSGEQQRCVEPEAAQTWWTQ